MAEITTNPQIEEMIANPFDLDFEKSENTFNDLISENPKKVREIFTHQQRVYEKFKQSGLKEDRAAINPSMFVPLAENKNFPGNFSLQKEETLQTSLTHTTLKILESLVNEHPEQLLLLNMPDFSDPTAEELAELDTIEKDLEQYAENLDNDYFEKHITRRRKKFREIDERQKQSKLSWLKKNLVPYFQNPDSLHEIQEDNAEIIYQRLFEASLACRETLFYQISFTEASDLISHIAPNLKEIAEKLKDEIVLIKNVKRKPWGRELNYWDEQLENFAFSYLNGTPLMTVEKPLHTGNLYEKDHPVRIVVLGHELFHAITDNVQHLSSIPYEEILKHLKKGNGKAVFGQLQRVVAEGISIAFEFEALSRIKQSSDNPMTLEAIHDYTQQRLEYIKRANRQWNEEIRTRIDKENNQEYLVETDEIVALAYSEGSRLAIALRRNGWTLNDLPELLERIQQEVSRETGDKNPSAIYSVAVKRNESLDTPYTRIIQRIRALKKN